MRGRARLPAAQAGRHTVAAQASAFPGLRSSTPYQRSGAPGLPSGGRAAGHKQPRFTRGVKRHARRASPASVQRVRSRRAVVVPGRGKGLRRRQSVRYRGRHRLPRALFCQAPFNAPGAPGRPFGGRWDAGRRDVLAVLSAAAVQVPRPRVRSRRAVVVPGHGKGQARLDNSAGPFS